MRNAIGSFQAGDGLQGKNQSHPCIDSNYLQAPICSHFCGEGVRKGASDLFLLWQRVSRQAKVAAARREKKLSWGAQNHLPMQPLWKDFHKEGQP